MRVIYPDEVFFINFAADWLLLTATAHLAGVSVKRRRVAPAALFGGLYAVAVQFTELGFAATTLFKLAAAVTMALIVFGGQRHLLRLTLLFLAVSAAFAGAVMAASLLGAPGGGMTEPVSFGVFFVSFAVCWAVFSLVFRQMAKHRTTGTLCAMTVREGAKTVAFAALVDTGNGLTDPMTGEGVTVCRVGDMEGLFPERVRTLLRRSGTAGAAETFRALRGAGMTRFFLVPYATLGQREGLMLAFRPEEIRKNGRPCGGLIGLVPDAMIDGKGYAAVTGGEKEAA